jgi:hypothetical protein
MQGELALDASIEREVLRRARQNFQARNGREDRAWNRYGAQGGRVLLILSDRERSEFLDHARYELGVELHRAVANSQNRAAQVQVQGQRL